VSVPVLWPKIFIEQTTCSGRDRRLIDALAGVCYVRYESGTIGAVRPNSRADRQPMSGQPISGGLMARHDQEATRSCFVPRWLVGRNDHAGRRRDTVGKAQLHIYTFREQPPSSAEHHRVDHQQVLVDQVSGHQRADQLTAAHHRHDPIGLSLESANRFGNVATQQRRVGPREWFGERSRNDILGRVVERGSEGTIGLAIPVRQQVLVRPSPKQPPGQSAT